MELYLLRHGIPVDSASWDGPDATRPLTDAGEAQVLRVLGRLHERNELVARRVLTSPFVRAAQTATLAARVLGVALEQFEPLASGSSPDRILRGLARRGGDEGALLLVGHSPDLSMLTAALAGGSSLEHPFDRCGIARLSGSLEPGGMRRLWLLSPQEVT